MKNLETFSKRVLVSAVALSMVLLSASLLISSANSAHAGSKNPNANERLTEVDIWSFGITNGKAYWIEYNNTGWQFKSANISEFKEE